MAYNGVSEFTPPLDGENAKPHNSDTAVVDVVIPSAKAPKELVENLRKTFNSEKSKSIKFRKIQLQNLMKFLEDNKDEICEVLYKDLRKPKMEAYIYEVVVTINEIKNLLWNLKDYVNPEYPEKGIINLLDTVKIHKDPYGLVLILSAWNYPLQLSITPLAGAIAAGNCVILKPSEQAPATSEYLAKVLPTYLDPDCYKIHLGGHKETNELLEERFDYIFYTGSLSGGKIIHQAANKYLTPCTFELGGKSPAYIDDSADMDITAKRLLWGKCMNSGQTCIAPDYILCTKQVQEKFIQYAGLSLKQFYGNTPNSSIDYARIVNNKQFFRLANLIKDRKIAIGGNVNPDDRYIHPTIVADVAPDDPLMEEELFGPILPIVNVQNIEEAIYFINSKEKPLALYIFSKKSKDVESIIERTSSGGVCVNDVITHAAVECLPFGGVGLSGMGSYHGKSTFDTFVHKKSVLKKNFRALPEKLQALRYPPYTDFKQNSVTMFLTRRRGFSLAHLANFMFFILGVAVALISQYVCTYFF